MPNLFILPVVIAFDLLIAVIVVRLILRYSWKPLEGAFPEREPTEPSIGRKFQSFEISRVGFGYYVHVLIDDNHLHLRPAWLLRQLGLKPVSIPWDAIEPLPTSKSGGTRTRVKIRKQTMTGPKWCFKLVRRLP